MNFMIIRIAIVQQQSDRPFFFCASPSVKLVADCFSFIIYRNTPVKRADNLRKAVLRKAVFSGHWMWRRFESIRENGAGLACVQTCGQLALSWCIPPCCVINFRILKPSLHAASPFQSPSLPAPKAHRTVMPYRTQGLGSATIGWVGHGAGASRHTEHSPGSCSRSRTSSSRHLLPKHLSTSANLLYVESVQSGGARRVVK